MGKLLGIVCACLVLISSHAFAAAKTTSMSSKWICTTNASTSENKSDKDADTKMSNQSGSVKSSFAFAMKHCRDCTKITCESK